MLLSVFGLDGFKDVNTCWVICVGIIEVEHGCKSSASRSSLNASELSWAPFDADACYGILLIIFVHSEELGIVKVESFCVGEGCLWLLPLDAKGGFPSFRTRGRCRGGTYLEELSAGYTGVSF